MILRVHPSNFRSLGFVEDVSVEALCGLGAPVIDDVGSGVLGAHANGLPTLADEPAVARSVAAGAALVCCSGDKLLGGPQAGILVGRADAIAAARSHPLARALRIDKLSLAALEATLTLYRDPARARRRSRSWRCSTPMTASSPRRRRASARGHRRRPLRDRRRGRAGRRRRAAAAELPGPAVALRSSTRRSSCWTALRAGEPPLMARVHEGRVLLDPRTLPTRRSTRLASCEHALSG